MKTFYYVVTLVRGKKSRDELLRVDDNQNLMRRMKELEARYKDTPTKVANVMPVQTKAEAGLIISLYNDQCRDDGTYLDALLSICGSDKDYTDMYERIKAEGFA